MFILGLETPTLRENSAALGCVPSCVSHLMFYNCFFFLMQFLVSDKVIILSHWFFFSLLPSFRLCELKKKKDCSLYYVEMMIIFRWSYSVEVGIDSDSHLGRRPVLQE